MSITIKSGAKVLYQWERGVALTASTPCDILRISREDDRVTDDLYPVISGSTGTALIPDRMLTESGYLHVSRIDHADGSERVLETVRILVRHAAKPQNTASSTKEIDDMQTIRMQMAALERAAREGKFDGKDGTTPHIGENGNWFAGDVDLGIRARGEKGDKGDPGDTPHIGENGNWYIGEEDTGVFARNEDVSLYADDMYTSGILEKGAMQLKILEPSGSNVIRYEIESAVVYIKGIRRARGGFTTSTQAVSFERLFANILRLNVEKGTFSWRVAEVTRDGDNLVNTDNGEIYPARSGGYYDLIPYLVHIPAGATSITYDKVEDLRADERYCGYVRDRLAPAYVLTEGDKTEIAEMAAGKLQPGIDEIAEELAKQSDAIANSQEHDLSQFFELVNKDYFYNPTELFNHYFQMLGGIREIELAGFDYTLPTRIRMICRNHDSWKYRFIISQRDEDGWKDTFDTYNLDVIENTGGLTEVVATKSKTAVRMLIDFSYMTDGENYIDGMLDVDGRYNLKKTCFREYNEQLSKEVSGRYTWVNGELNVFQNGARWRFNTNNNNSTMVCTGYGTEDDFREFVTDILAPFSVKAQQNADGDRVKTWGYTGGNHAYADTSGTPTAKTTLIELFVNNKPVTEKSGNFRTLTLHCKQEVQAWNTCKEDGTGRAVLIEDDVYIFDGEKMNVEVKITPLETIFIGTYYAMQLALPHPYTAYGDKVVSMTGEHDDCIPEYIEGASDNFTIRMHLDSAGIGKYQYNTSSFKYKTSNNKAYYHPMENSGEFTTADILWFKGYYRIYKTRT